MMTEVRACSVGAACEGSGRANGECETGSDRFVASNINRHLTSTITLVGHSVFADEFLNKAGMWLADVERAENLAMNSIIING